jgi:hypothetical protein
MGTQVGTNLSHSGTVQSANHIYSLTEPKYVTYRKTVINEFQVMLHGNLLDFSVLDASLLCLSLGHDPHRERISDATGVEGAMGKRNLDTFPVKGGLDFHLNTIQ